MIYFTAHTFKCVCHCRRAMFRVLGIYNFEFTINQTEINQNFQCALCTTGEHGWCKKVAFCVAFVST